MVEQVIYVLVFTAVLGTLLSILLRLPFAIYNRLNGQPTRVSKTTRRIINVVAFLIALVIGLLTSNVDRYLQRTDNNTIDTGIAEAITAAAINVAILSEYYAEHGSFQGVAVGELYNETRFDTRDKFIDSVDFLTTGDAAIAVIVAFKNTDALPGDLRGREVRYATVDGGLNWTCSRAINNAVLRGDNLLPVDHLPRDCR